MQDWPAHMHWVWLGLALVFALGELLLPYFGLIFASGAAILGALAAALHAVLGLQAGVFSLALAVSLLALRPRIVRKFHAGSHGVPTRTTRLIGRLARVTAATDPDTGLARAAVEGEGEDWAVSAAVPLVLGDAVRVESADGIVLQVIKG